MSKAYPLTKDYFTEAQIIGLLEKLRSYNKNKSIHRTMVNGEFKKDVHITINCDRYLKFAMLTDYFSDKCRIQCLVKGCKYTPLQYYNKYRKSVLRKSMVNGKFSLEKFNDIIYFAPKTRFCNKFNIIVAYTVYKIFKPRHILDSSAGWGDRLIAAIAYGCNYHGCDPSQCMKPMYKKMIKTLAPGSQSYRVDNVPFEEAKIRNDFYDLAFTSPPFFDKETYEEHESQSLCRYDTRDKWVSEFLIPLADKNLAGLRRGGYFVIYVPKFAAFMKHMKSLSNVKFCGRVTYNYCTKSMKRVIYVWRKM